MWLCNSKIDVHVNVRQISPVKWWLILKGYKKLRCFELSSRGDSWKLTFPDTNSSTSGMFKLYFHFGVTKIYKIKISSHERMNRAEMTSIFYWSFCQNYLFWDRLSWVQVASVPTRITYTCRVHSRVKPFQFSIFNELSVYKFTFNRWFPDLNSLWSLGSLTHTLTHTLT